MSVIVAVSWGELLDKISILEIKRERLTDPAQRANVDHEYVRLCETRDAEMPGDADIGDSVSELRTINEALWDIEDDIRGCEREKDFGDQFIELARAVYRNNDRRAAIKRDINEALGSEIVEEKSYTDYE
ncbi:MAG: hypothetical protein GKS00_18120 [Alphaproteobacteria bacterium]|nr:hypothetical protein [Alphaproteobacteria bacterium]